MINLHTHTNCSDGVLNPAELLSKLKQNNITIASITDHDTVEAYKKIKNIDKYFSGILVPGIEMKTVHQDYAIEILGYYIDIDKMKNYLKDKRTRVSDLQKVEYENGISVFNKLNLKYDKYDLKEGEYAGATLYRLLNKYYEYNSQIIGKDILASGVHFYRKTILNSNSPFYVDESKYIDNAKDVINKIHEFGGLAFLAHPGVYSQIEDKSSFILDLINTTEIDGIECYYSLHTVEETKKYINIAEENNLLISGGSDYHGTEMQNIILQKNINIKKLSWLKK